MRNDLFVLKYCLQTCKTQEVCDNAFEDSGRVTFSSDEICNLSVDLNNINLDDANFFEDDPENLIMSDVWLGTIDLKNKKQLKKV